MSDTDVRNRFPGLSRTERTTEAINEAPRVRVLSPLVPRKVMTKLTSRELVNE